jgi:hypothetical protein
MRPLPPAHQLAAEDARLTATCTSLQATTTSRLHKLQEAMSDRAVFNPDTGEFISGLQTPLREAHVFIVRHDWSAVLGEAVGSDEAPPLPYPLCAFEFRLRERTVIAFVQVRERDDSPVDGLSVGMFIEAVGGMWVWSSELTDLLAPFLITKQVRAVSVMLESGVAEHHSVAAPPALNKKRARLGKPLISDFHVVDLAPASARADQSPAEEFDNSGRRMRLHFRRGHWRHLDDRRTWVSWTLVGNADLGWIEKEYRI